MRTIKWFAILAISLINLSALAQSGYVHGRITDSKNYPLPGAAVYLHNHAEIGTITDINGFYRIKNLKDGDYTIKVNYIGFKEAVAAITIANGEGAEANFILNEGIELQEIKINGQLQGQTKALNQQKNSIKITNVIASDQVERFPDSNIGDALKRIPGINVQYDQGEARFGNIRGTAPDLNSVTINGERIPSAEAETRSVQLDLIPADMVQSIEVSKVVTADMEGDAIGGSVNLVTRSKPVDRRISGTVGSGYNFLSQKPMAVGSIVYGDRFINNKLGMVLSGSYFNHQLGSDNIEAEWEDDGNMKDFQIRTYEVQRERQSYSASFDFNINDKHSLDLKGIYNRRKDWENRYRLRYKDIEQDDNGNWVSEIRRQTKAGTSDNKYARLEDQTTMNFSLGGEHHFGILTADWKAAYSKAKEERPNERYLSMRYKDASIEQELGDTKKPNVMVNTPEAKDLNSNWGFKELTEEFQFTDDIDKTFSTNFELPTTGSSNLKFGFKYKSKEKKRDNKFYEYEPVDEDAFIAQATSGANIADETRDNFRAGDYTAGSFVTKEFVGGLTLDGADFEGEENKEETAGNFNAKEDVYAGYFRWDQTITSQLTAVAGIRYEYTNVEYAGFIFDPDGIGEGIPTGTQTSDYANLLPSVLLKYDISELTKLKAAWTNTLARPRYFDLVPYEIYNREDEELAVGNSKLNATSSMNFDLMLEHYFQSIGVVSAGLYYKGISDYIANQRTNEMIDGSEWRVYQPINAGDADLFGFEAAFQRQFNFLPGFLKNIGLYANYSYNYSKVNNVKLEDRENEELELPGTPEHTLNASLFYESKKLTLRASLNYASDFLDEYGSEAFEDRYYDKATHVDLSGSYDLSKNLKIFAEVNNLLDQPLRYYQGDEQYTMQAEYYGVRMQGGIRFNF
ncbi:TonB-dependent receptor [Carboxylicivirga sediminis]|uniref:TonB-dependent receptor n=1 Tax=Carboxylicivirga sediminis TaxID=2006564 RepID=A0A941F6U4_9BACT|nr:TonB-dependent receptor [Carboxylicivirga sediminis]MBR8537813.1 TonB-dependent receptor [Carboxylicivirga sediminis]